jgi:hypothetical protein
MCSCLLSGSFLEVAALSEEVVEELKVIRGIGRLNTAWTDSELFSGVKAQHKSCACSYLLLR